MPKRDKPKPVSTKSLDKKPSAAKQARIVKQLEQTNDNKTRARQGTMSPWQEARANRHNKRIAAGKTYENWMRTHSARYEETKPTASNLLVD